jgi:hypothetical protein
MKTLIGPSVFVALALGSIVFASCDEGLPPNKQASLTSTDQKSSSLLSHKDLAVYPNAESQSAPLVSAQSLVEWHKAMTAAPSPKTGCFEATHPSTEWVEVPCSTTRHSHPPGGTPGLRAPAPAVTGGVPQIGPGWMATTSGGHISQVVGSFFDVNVSSENQNGQQNDFSLQLNTNSNINIPATLCGTRANCNIGWEQFVYWEGDAEVWYILFGYGSSCPPNPPNASWSQPSGTKDCYLNAPNRSKVPSQKITNLGNMTVTGVAGTTNDAVTVTTGDGKLYKATNTSYLNLINSWTFAEFNVFGNNSYANATFGANSTLSVKLSLTNGTTASPTCTSGSTTGETNSLNLVPASCCASGGTSPAITFIESNAAVMPTPPFCLLNDITPIEYSLM